ncbi:MAG: hypothetical protein K5771_08875 [Oscillospiraceae bacterium]|nr:hypothetical protein [Oscillospiraceae bacterium]
MKTNTLELVFILDKSGSMQPLTEDTIGGFNSNIEKHKEDGDAFVTTVLFDNRYRIIHDRIPINEIPVLTKKDYEAEGSTALFDAVGRTISHIEDVHRYIRKEDIPESVLFVIITDGMENASIEYRGNQIRAMVEKKKTDGWNFIFIGAGIDAYSEAADLGISQGAAFDISPSRAGINNAFRYSRAAGRVSRQRRAPNESFEEMLRKEIDKAED